MTRETMSRDGEHPTDDALDRLARGLRFPVETRPLWRRVERALPSSARASRATRPGPRLLAPLLATAAALLLLVSAGRFLFKGEAVPRLLLSDQEASAFEQELSRVQGRIAALEPRLTDPVASRVTGPAATRRPLLLAQLDYLEANIQRCREGLARNTNNRELRRSLLRSSLRKERILEAFLAPPAEQSL